MSSDPVLVTSRVTEIEVRRNLTRLLDGTPLDAARRRFAADLDAFALVVVDAATCNDAARIAEETLCRALDSIHLASALRAGLRRGPDVRPAAGRRGAHARTVRPRRLSAPRAPAATRCQIATLWATAAEEEGSVVSTIVTESQPSGAPAARAPWWRTAPGALFHAACAATALGWMVAAATPGWSWPRVLVCAIGTLVLALLWIVRLAGFSLDRAATSMRGRRRSFIVLPALTMLTSVVLWAGLPMRVAFERSRPAFDELALDWQLEVDSWRAMPTGGLPRPEFEERVQLRTIDAPPHLGWYGVSSVRADLDRLIVFTSGAPMGAMTGSASAGFAYAPDGDLPTAGPDLDFADYQPLGDGWYSFTAR
jgi:hypothetical protein